MNNLMNMKQIYNYLYHHLKEETLNKEEAQMLFQELERLFYESVSEENIEFNRKDQMMIALENESKQRLQYLEEKIQKGSQVAAIQEQTIHIAQLIQEFWHEAGFHYVITFRMNHYGTLELELGFSLNYGSMTSDKPVTAKEKRQKTKERLLEEGYILNDKETSIIDCDLNKQKISDLLLSRFPSAAIFSWETFLDNHKTKQHNLRSIHVRIPKIEEILHLKTPQ